MFKDISCLYINNYNTFIHITFHQLFMQDGNFCVHEKQEQNIKIIRTDVIYAPPWHDFFPPLIRRKK